MYIYKDKTNKFVEIFNPENGFYVRSGVIENNKDTGKDPFIRNYPNLLDIGIMATCENKKNGLCTVECYQGIGNEPNMKLETYKKIIDQCKGKVFSVALGGRGDPNLHENFEEILRYTRENGIIPNYTTSGINLTEKQVSLTKELCGAVAISFYNNKWTYRALDMFIKAGVKTNIHFVLSNDSIDTAIEKLEEGSFYKGINAVVFLLHKPVGLGTQKNVLKYDDPKVKRFFELVDGKTYNFQIGFDSCSCSGILNFTHQINRDFIDYCEGARYSAYITSDNKLLPCSFDNQDLRWAVDLNKYTIQEAWESKVFENFRNHFKYSCSSCLDRESCGGGCPIVNEITLCNRQNKEFYRKEKMICC